MVTFIDISYGASARARLMGSQLLVFTNDLLDYIVMICLSLKDKQTAANKFKDDSHKNSSFIFIAQHGRGEGILATGDL